MAVFRCVVCNTEPGAPEWKARRAVLWANQYGREERIFCDVCGAWSDVRLIYESENGEQKTLVCRPTNPAFADESESES